MKTLALILGLTLTILILACGGDPSGQQGQTTARQAEQKKEEKVGPHGVGPVTNVELTDPLNQNMIRRGRAISDVKCAACHKYETEERLVGPGYLNLTNRRTPEWIMNMILNVEVMLDRDPIAQKLLEECLVRMPNQNISKEEARDLLEFFRHLDEEHSGKRDQAKR